MRVALRSLVVCLACSVAVVAPFPAVAFAEEPSPLGGTGGGALGNPLVIPDAQSLLGRQAVIEAEEAQRSSPEAVAARTVSATVYEGLDAEEGAKRSEPSRALAVRGVRIAGSEWSQKHDFRKPPISDRIDPIDYRISGTPLS